MSGRSENVWLLGPTSNKVACLGTWNRQAYSWLNLTFDQIQILLVNFFFLVGHVCWLAGSSGGTENPGSAFQSDLHLQLQCLICKKRRILKLTRQNYFYKTTFNLLDPLCGRVGPHSERDHAHRFFYALEFQNWARSFLYLNKFEKNLS